MHHFSTDAVGCGELLSISHSEVITTAHRALLRAGVNALVTNTFGATFTVMEDYGAEGKVSVVNRESARLALQVAEEAPSEKQQPLVVGSIGPTCKLLSLHPEGYEATVETLTSAYLDQARSLWEEGVSIFHLERCDDPLNTKAALMALTRLEDQIASPLTKVVTAHVGHEGTMVLGTSVDAFWRMVQPFNPQAFGVVGRFEDVEESLALLSYLVEVPLIAMVDAFAVASPEGWLQSPKSLSAGLAGLVSHYEVRIAGVGVEADPDFIGSLAETLRKPLNN
jgi:5-methyltetrahydrofolate--homocysteine methyltransferase